MILGWDGNVWFTRGTSIDRVTVDGAITEFHVPSGGQPSAILMSGDNNIWFTEPSSGKLGQLVMSSITPGGSATINESSAIFPAAVHGLFILPPAFASSSGAAHTLGIKQTCPPMTIMAPDTFGVMVKVTVQYPPPCESVKTQLFGQIESINSGNALLDMTFVMFGSGAFSNSLQVAEIGSTSEVHASDQATIVTAILNLTGGPGVTISNVSTNDPSATVSFNGLKATIASSMSSMTAKISLSPLQGMPLGSIAGAAVISSNVTDPDPRNHIASFFLDTSSGGRRGAIPPDLSDVVVTPVKRGH